MRDPKVVVREGYDAISLAYRPEDFNYEGTVYQQLLVELDRHLPESSRALDLGCGCPRATAAILCSWRGRAQRMSSTIDGL